MGTGSEQITLYRLKRHRVRWPLLVALALLGSATLAIKPAMQPVPAQASPAVPLAGPDIGSELEAQGGPLYGWDAFVEDARARWRVPGLAIAVVQGDRIVKLKGYGTVALSSDQRVNADTIFSLASLSKAFTAYGVAQLADEGRLDWDKPVREVVPEFALSDPAASAGATPRDLLTHRTGLPRHDKLWANNPSLTGTELLKRLPYLRMTAPLRQRFQYNNLMYEVAGEVTARASGMPWENYMRTRVFDPLGMTRSGTSLAAMLADPNHAAGHHDDGAVHLIGQRRLDGIGPAGGINSTARDMAQWLRLHLNAGRLGERQLLSPEKMADLHRAIVVTGAAFTDETADWGYAMGWRVGLYRKYTRIYHGGVLDGFTSRISLFPELGLGIVVLANVEDAPLPERLTRHLVDRLTGQSGVDWSGKSLVSRDAGDQRRAAAIARAKKAEPREEPASQILERYTGVYADPGYGEVRIERQGARLVATYNNVPMALDHRSYDVFRSRTDDDMFDRLTFQFRMDALGRIAEVLVPMEQRIAPIRFERAPPPELADTAVLRRLVGRYQNGDEIWQLGLSGGRMTLSVNGSVPQPLQPDIVFGFLMPDDTQARIDFVMDRSGAPTAMRAHLIDGLYLMPRLDDRLSMHGPGQGNAR